MLLNEHPCRARASCWAHWRNRPPLPLPRPFRRLYFLTAFPHLPVQTFWSGNLLIGISVFTSGSISQDLSTHILMWVDHSRSYKKLKMLSTAIFVAARIKWCKVSQLCLVFFTSSFLMWVHLHLHLIISDRATYKHIPWCVSPQYVHKRRRGFGSKREPNAWCTLYQESSPPSHIFCGVFPIRDVWHLREVLAMAM